MPLEEQSEFESQRLWKKVSDAIINDDQQAATEEKFVLEEAQRAGAKDRKAKEYDHISKYFEMGSEGQFVYKHSDCRPWDPRNDLFQYEKNYIICTKTKHKTPMVRTQSIVSVSEAAKGVNTVTASGSRRGHRGQPKEDDQDKMRNGTQPTATTTVVDSGRLRPSTASAIEKALQPLQEQQKVMTDRMAKLQHTLDVMNYQQKERDSNSNINRDMVMLVVLVVMIQVIKVEPNDFGRLGSVFT